MIAPRGPRGETFEVPTRADRVATLASEVIGGPVGRYARVGRRAWVPAAAVLSALSSALIALGVLRANHCLREGWSTPGSLWRMCYSDLPAAVNGPMPAHPFVPGGPGETQPVLTAVVTWVARWLVPDGVGPGASGRWYVAIAAVLIALLTAACVVALAWMLPDRPWRAGLLALSPLLVTSSLISFDLLGVALMTAGLAAWIRRHPVGAGALLGAATMARSFPLVVLAAVLMVGWHTGRRADVRAAAVAAATLVAGCVLLAVAFGGDPWSPYAVWSTAEVSYGSIWLVAQICGLDAPTSLGTVVAALGWGLALVVGWRLARRARPESVFAVATVMLAIVMVTAKSNSLQSALWLLPLLAASRLPWREYLAWVGVELVAFAGTWLYVGHGFDEQKSLPGPGYVLVSSLRLLALAAMAWRVYDLDRRAIDD